MRTYIHSLAALLLLVGILAAQTNQSTPQTPVDVVKSIRVISVRSKTGLAKSEMLEGALQKKKEFDEWGWVVMQSGRSDLDIEIGYQTMTFYYTYRAVHANGMVIASGKVVALDGPDASRKIADAIIGRVKKLRGPEGAEKSEAKQKKN